MASQSKKSERKYSKAETHGGRMRGEKKEKKDDPPARRLIGPRFTFPESSVAG